MFAYYDPDADIAWLPTGESDDVVSERVPDGLRDYDRATRQLVATEQEWQGFLTEHGQHMLPPDGEGKRPELRPSERRAILDR